MPSASAFLDEPQAPSASAFLDEGLTPPDETLSDRIRKFLFEPEGAKVTREAIQGAVESIPHMALDTAKMGYKGLRMAMGGPEERVKILTEDVIPSALQQGQQTAADIQSPFGTKEWLRGAGQVGMMALPGLELAREIRAPVEIPREIPPVETPPVQVPPEPTLAQKIMQPRVEPPAPQEPLAPVTPETPPAPEVADTGLGFKTAFSNVNATADLYQQAFDALRAGQNTISGVRDPILARHKAAFDRGEIQSPEDLKIAEEGKGVGGITPEAEARAVLERRKGILARKAELTARAANGEQGLEPQLAAVEAELNDPVTNPVVHAPPVEAPSAPAVEIPPEDVRYAGGEPPTKPPVQGPPPIKGPSEPVGGNVAGFEKVYGPGEVPAGETISPEDAWDTASARAQGGKAQPYGFVDRARTGAITPEEMGDLIYEHHRLVERAAGLEGMPEYAGASQAAKDFASNVLKPAETAWHQKGMVMQIERPVNLNTFTGMDQLMQTELGRGIKPSEAPKFTRMAEDVKNGESEVVKAVERSDARVRTKYAKVRDIPIEEAVARVKQMLKDCM